MTITAKLSLLDVLLLALTFLAGYMDALSYLGLNGAFTANMTGNLVLLGLAAGQAAGDRALGSGIALVGFALGAAGGGRVIGSSREEAVWPSRVTVALGLELAVLAAFALGWYAMAAHPTAPAHLLLIGAAAVAMGIQSAVGRRVGVSGISTTYVTGTLTSLMTELVAFTGARAGRLRWAAVIGALTLGALLGAVVLRLWPAAAPLPPVALLVVVTLIALRRFK